MMLKFFSHNCPTINFLSMVNRFCCLEILRTGGFSAESIVMSDPNFTDPNFTNRGLSARV